MTRVLSNDADRPGAPDALHFERVDPESDLARTALDRYVAELARRFPDGFDPSDPGGREAQTLRAPRGAFVVALRNGALVGCGGVRTLSAEIGEIKRMWIDPQVRGLGLGSQLLRHLESISADLGHSIVRLDTNDNLTEAITMYRRRGYHEIERYNDNPYARCWFEKEL